MSDLVDLIAKKFIARRDIKAMQKNTPKGEYWPVILCACGKVNCYKPEHKEGRQNLPWKKSDIQAHLNGEATYGHYLLDENDKCKLFALDIDLEEDGFYPEPFAMVGKDKFEGEKVPFNPREAWRVRSHPARTWMKFQFRVIAATLGHTIQHELGIPWAVAYSGAKGIHVYGFTGLIPAADARDAAQIVIDAYGGLEAFRGEHFFRFTDRDPVDSFPNLSIEVFPKQKSLHGKSMGNLMRLPLGKNLKSNDPTFFVDMSTDLREMRPVDPIHALTTTDPWAEVPQKQLAVVR